MSKAWRGSMFLIDDSPHEVTRAIITDARISLDWIEDGDRGGLTVTSSDGLLYKGTVTYPGWPDHVYHTSLGKYTAANGVIILFGRWQRSGDSEQGTWAFQLPPDSSTGRA